MAYSLIKLNQVVSVRGGKRLPLGHDLTQKITNHPYIRARDIGDGKITFDDPVYINENTYSLIKNYIVNENDVCVTIVGANVGDIGIVPTSLNGANLTENAVKLLPRDNIINNKFLKYCLLINETKLQMKQLAGGGAAQPKLGLYKINSLEIPFPTLDIQNSIVSILSKYDDLIENNEKRIKILEEMAQRLYTEWFVKFKFPGHENVKMIDSRFGKIPERWVIKKLSDVLEFAYGKALVESDREAGTIPVYGSSGIVGTHNKSIVSGPSIVVGRKGNVGSLFWVNEDFYPIDTTFYVISSYKLEFIYYLLKSQTFSGGDSAVPGLNRSYAYSKLVLLPTNEQIEDFSLCVAQYFSFIGTINKQIRSLSKMRDLLIPQLTTGKRELKV